MKTFLVILPATLLALLIVFYQVQKVKSISEKAGMTISPVISVSQPGPKKSLTSLERRITKHQKKTSYSIQEKNRKRVVASWYGEQHHGKQTASGEIYNMYRFTIAHKTLPLGTIVKLTNPSNGKSVRCVINDRGPFIKGRDIDVSYATAEWLGFTEKGIKTLYMEKVKGKI